MVVVGLKPLGMYGVDLLLNFVVIIIKLYNLILVSKSAKIKRYKIRNIDKNSLVLINSRIKLQKNKGVYTYGT